MVESGIAYPEAPILTFPPVRGGKGLGSYLHLGTGRDFGDQKKVSGNKTWEGEGEVTAGTKTY
jgi:hypothetical protein